ncbi:XtrA/YqaO family protein [Sporosarcina limicola]|uniref:Uncharacterized protein n=1 Tax=Sporosarcina limicola TaxID=34101 RepID=A0A927MHM3_9BACL|nr:hypothetical protein [Sporosarcina limicola]
MTSPRMKELQISSQGILNIDTMELSESCVIVISDGKAKMAELPLHADMTIKTYKGIVTRVNWDEGEEF